MNTEIVAYQPTAAAIADLVSRYKGIVFDVKTPTGMVEAKAAYKDINGHNITLEAARVKEKAESLAYGRKVDSEAKRIADQLDALRLPIKEMIETETKREQREKQEREDAAKAFMIAQAAAEKAAEEKRMAEERAEIARQQAELARQQREAQAKIDEANRAARLKIEEEERASRLAREEADRVARQAREAEEAKAKAIRDAEEARLKAERDRIDAEARAIAESQRKAQAEADAKARAEREAEEAKQREIQRLSNELNDGRKMLQTFVDRFGKRGEFESVANFITGFLKS